MGITPGRLQSVHFGAVHFGDRGGMHYDERRHELVSCHWIAPIKEEICVIERRPLSDQLPPALKAVLQRFQVEYMIGIPPGLAFKNTPITGQVGKRPSSNTNGILAMIALSILKSLPPADSMEGAISQLEMVLQQVSDISDAKTRKYQEQYPQDRFEKSPPIVLFGPSVGSLKDRIYSIVHASHLSFAAKNGALAILGIPTPGQLKEILLDDPKAQAMFLEKQPLDVNREKFSRKRFETIEEVLTFLDDLEAGAYPERVEPKEGFTDLHAIMSAIELDYPRHFERGRLKVLINKPGKDDRTVWENLAQVDAAWQETCGNASRYMPAFTFPEMEESEPSKRERGFRSVLRFLLR